MSNASDAIVTFTNMLPPDRHEDLAALWKARGYWAEESVWDVFDASARRRPGADALIDGASRLTMADVRDRAERLAGALFRIGVGPGDVVAVQLPNWWETVVAFWAVIRLGAVLNPILPAYREREVEFILREGGARVLIVPGTYRGFDHRDLGTRLRSRLPNLRHVVITRDDPGPAALSLDALSAAQFGADLPRPPRAEDVFLLMYTSGTTADPKGVLHSHRTLLYEVRSLERVHSLGETDATLMASPLTHVSGLIHAVLCPAVLGTRAVLMDRWDADAALDTILREGVTYMVGAPVFLSDLTFHPALERKRPRTLRLFSCGGAGVAPELIVESRRRLGCISKRVYGSTEFPTLTTTGPDDPPDRGAATEGRPIGAAELLIADQAGRALPPGSEGEILARGPECFLGYRNAALDAEAFTADGWFRTGDLGVVDAEGYLTVTGRKKDIVIRKGEKISASEVEGIIAGHPAVAEVAVVALPDPSTGEQACACVLLRPGRGLSLPELTGFLRERGLPTWKLPESLEIVDELPRTASGKVQKHRLSDLVRDRRGR